MSFHVLIATIGRPSLESMLHGLKKELGPEDALTIVFDGHSKEPNFDLTNFQCKVTSFCEPKALGASGHAIRNKYKNVLERRDFVMHADDDDIYVPGIFHKLRAQCTNTQQLYIAKMQDWNKVVVPKEAVLKPSHVGTPCGIIP